MKLISFFLFQTWKAVLNKFIRRLTGNLPISNLLIVFKILHKLRDDEQIAKKNVQEFTEHHYSEYFFVCQILTNVIQHFDFLFVF